MKFYFVSYSLKFPSGSISFRNSVLKNKHPLDWQFDLDLHSQTQYVVINWQEITEAEYNRFAPNIGG